MCARERERERKRKRELCVCVLVVIVVAVNAVLCERCRRRRRRRLCACLYARGPVLPAAPVRRRAASIASLARLASGGTHAQTGAGRQRARERERERHFGGSVAPLPLARWRPSAAPECELFCPFARSRSLASFFSSALSSLASS